MFEINNFSELIHILFQIDFYSFLDNRSLFELAKCSSYFLSTTTSSSLSKKTPFFPQLNFPGNFTPSLTHIQFGDLFNKPVDNLPNFITNISFGKEFNQHVNHLPSSLKILSFAGKFNQTIYILPSSLLRLSIFGNFNQNVDNLPASLQKLHLLGPAFDKKFSNLPALLTNLTIPILAKDASTSLDSLPNFLKYLKIISHLDVLFIDSWPKNLTSLHLNGNSNSKFIVTNNFPNSLKILSIPTLVTTSDLPRSLKKLKILSTLKNLQNLPPNLTHLWIGIFDQPLKDLPASLTHLSILYNFDQNLENLPSLKYLKLPACFKKPLNQLPPSLNHLEISANFPYGFNTLPPSLNHLVFTGYGKINQFVEKVKSKSLKLSNSNIKIHCKVAEKLGVKNSTWYSNVQDSTLLSTFEIAT